VSIDEVGDAAAPEDRRIEDAECAALLSTFRTTLEDTERGVMDAYFGDERRSQADVGAALGMSRDQVYRTITKIRARAGDFFAAKGWFDGP